LTAKTDFPGLKIRLKQNNIAVRNEKYYSVKKLKYYYLAVFRIPDFL